MTVSFVWLYAGFGEAVTSWSKRCGSLYTKPHPAGTSLRLGLQILFGCIVAFLNQGIIPAYTSNFLSPGPVAKQGIKKLAAYILQMRECQKK